jgi:23S rRNA pseudouridine1911/1915/1917 synthase
VVANVTRIAAGGENKESTLLDWLLRQHPDTPKSRAKQWILAGRVTVNGTVIRKPHHALADPGAGLVLQGRHAATWDCGRGMQIHPRVTLLHLDTALAVVNKGPGLIAVPATEGELSALNILADFLGGRLKPFQRGVGLMPPPPPVYRRLQLQPVHRLDQYTSGVFCMAANPTARGHLIEQLKAHTMGREYVAYVEGSPPERSGTWRNWLQLSRDEMQQRILTPAQAKAAGDEAREAVTHFDVMATFEVGETKKAFSKLRLRLETGRKHQIRAQAAHAGVPLIGDRTYNADYRTRTIAPGVIDFPRQALHALTLTLEHPEQPGKRMSWTAELPKDLRQLEGALRSGRIE